MPERGRNGREVGRKWDCLSNSSRARAKDEGRSELGAFRLSALDKSAFPAEEIVSEINSSKLIPPSTLLVRTKRKLVAKHPTFLLLPSLVPNSNFSQKARDRGIPETPFLTESSGWKSLKSQKQEWNRLGSSWAQIVTRIEKLGLERLLYIFSNVTNLSKERISEKNCFKGDTLCLRVEFPRHVLADESKSKIPFSSIFSRKKLNRFKLFFRKKNSLSSLSLAIIPHATKSHSIIRTISWLSGNWKPSKV